MIQGRGTTELIQKYRWIIVFLMAVPFFNDSYSVMLVDEWLMEIFKILVFLSLIAILAICRRKISGLTVVLFSIELWWLISTLLNYPLSQKMVYHKLLIDIVNALSVALIVEINIDDPLSLVKGLILNMELAIYPNFYTVVTSPKGSDYFLLGYDAVLVLWIIPAICVGFLYIAMNRKIIRGSLLIAASVLTAFIVWSATTIVALLAMFGFVFLSFIFSRIGKLKDIKIPASLFVILAAVLNVFVLFAYSGGHFPLIDFFIEKILHKSTSFTGRTEIWQEAIRMIKEKPLIGHGFRPEVHVSNGYADIFIHSHNQLLQRLNATGIIGLLLFALFHVELVRKLDRSENTFERTTMVAGVLGICMTYITDAYKKFFRFYLVFFLAYYVDEMIRNRMANKGFFTK